MLKIILNRLKPQVEKIIAEEQPGIFKVRILYEKYLQHQQNLYYVFIYFKKDFDSVWHADLWATMKKYISANLIRVIKNLFDKATSAVLFSGSVEDWFRTTLGVRQE